MLKKIKANPKAMMFSSFHTMHALSISIVIPFFSIILLEAGWEIAQITYFFAIFTLAMFIFSPIIGKLSDIVGRKKIIQFGLFMQIIFFLIYYFSTNIYLIYLARFLDGMAFAAVSVVMFSAFEDLISEERGFWTGIFLSVGTIGSFVGPIEAGFVADSFFAKSLLIISAVFAFISFLFLLYLPEMKIQKVQTFKKSDLNPLVQIKTFFSHRKLKGMAFIGMLANGKGEIYNIFFPIFVLTVLNLPKNYLGFLLAIPVLMHVLQFWFGKIADTVSEEFGTLLGITISAGAIFFLPYVKFLPVLVLLLVIYGIGGAIFNVNAWALMSRIGEEEKMEGEVVGTYYSLAKLGVFISTLASAYIINIIGITRTLQVFSIAILLCAVLTYFYFQPIFHHERKENQLLKAVQTKD